MTPVTVAVAQAAHDAAMAVLRAARARGESTVEAEAASDTAWEALYSARRAEQHRAISARVQGDVRAREAADAARAAYRERE